MDKGREVIRTEHLDSGYGRRVIVADAEIYVKRGKILVLIGPNGAGKSTVLRTIAGQLAPLGGTVYIDGSERASLSAAEIAKKQAVMLTDRKPSERMTCEEVVSLGRYPYTGRLGILSREDKKTVREAMKLVHVSGLADREYDAVSDGQRQRVLLARAICQEPEIMILDEPTSYLDIRHKLEFTDLLKSLVRERDIGVIMSMHELELAYVTADELLCIDSQGSICMSGSPGEVFGDRRLSTLFGLEEGRLSGLYSDFLGGLRSDG